MADGDRDTIEPVDPDDAAPLPGPDPFFGDALDDDDALGGGSRDWASWRNLWQVPAIVVSLVLIGTGLYVASRRAPENDFVGVLGQAEDLIGAGRYSEAYAQLHDVVEPNLAEATPAEEARFHAAVADWLAATEDARGVDVIENQRLVAGQYAKAADLGGMLSPARIERWGLALITLGRMDEARERIEQLEGLSVTGLASSDARDRRNRLLRRLVEYSLTREDLPYEAMMDVLRGYREDGLLSPADQAWVGAREAELRLESRRTEEAITHLLLEMRRLETVDPAPPPPDAWARLYTLLGRAYFDQGRFAESGFHLEEALRRAPEADPVRADALLLLGRIGMARDDPEAAFDRVDRVVRDYLDTRAYLPALLVRAEVRSILGEHSAALEDFQLLLERMRDYVPRRDLSPRMIATSLADRHDAALTMGDLDLALEYVSLAEALFDAGSVPIDVLHRIASTSRQIAENLLDRAVSAETGPPLRLEDVEPALRFEANRSYERAGNYFARHARALTGVADADQTWAQSLWLAGDSYDLAGNRVEAIRHFLEYIAGRSVDDPRRAEVTFRLAQAYEAELDYEAAARNYERVIAEHPRGTFGTRSHVPLARCYVALDRPREAEAQLVKVVDGRQTAQNPVTPGALDYRDALIELGRILHEEGQTTAAIERLTAAMERYPDDERIHEVRFRLADSYARRARELRAELKAEPMMSPGEQQTKQERARSHLHTAMGLFGAVVDGLDRLDEARLTYHQLEVRRDAIFNRADCAFELERYDLAQALYDQAAREYGDHYASMHALVQIVNCFDRLGDARAAEIAHGNALTRLRQLGDEAFINPEVLMDRAAWEQWLRSRPLGLAQ